MVILVTDFEIKVLNLNFSLCCKEIIIPITGFSAYAYVKDRNFGTRVARNHVLFTLALNGRAFLGEHLLCLSHPTCPTPLITNS